MPIYRDKTELLGTPTITGSVGISGIPTVTGTVGITNTPTVYLGGVPNVNASVTGSVSITGTPTVSITGTPTVTLSSNQVTASIIGTVTTQATGTTTVAFASAPAVTIANATASYEGNTILVGKLTGSSVIATGVKEALLTYVTGAEAVQISSLPAITGTVAIEGIAAVSGNLPISGIVDTGFDAYGLMNGDQAMLVKITGSTTSADAQYITGSVSITGTPTVTLSSNQVTASIIGTVITQATGTTVVAFESAPAVTIANATSSYEGNTILVSKLTGSSVIESGVREALLTYVTGAEAVQISSLPAITGTVAVEGVTAVGGNLPISGTVDTGFDAYSLPNSLQAVLVKITGSTTQEDAQYVTGTVSIGVNKYALPVGNALVVKTTGSSESDPQYVTGTVSIGADKYVLPSGNALLVKITGSTTSNDAQYVTGNVSVATSNDNPLIIKSKAATTATRTSFTTYGGPGTGSIDWTSTGSSNVSGTFILANSSSTRSGLMFSNNNENVLYVALGDTDFPDKNGFGLFSTSSAPFNYSFVVFPSGTYFAEPSFVGVKHSGFFVSSSNIEVSIASFITE